MGVAALVFIATHGAERPRRAYVAAGSALGVAFVAFVTTDLNLLRMSSGVFRHGFFDDPATSEVRFYRDGKTATIAVVDNRSKRSIRTNGKSDAARARSGRARLDRRAHQVLAAALLLAMRPDAKLVANIGLGSGLTTHTLLGSPRLSEVDTIEIERMMVEGARLFEPRNRRAFADPRSRIYIEDAKTFFAARGKRYDIIVSEPSNPWVSGVSTLFSEEFYGQVKRYLRPDGLLVQWVQAYEINPGLLSSIFQALGKHFPDYAIYGGGRSGDLFVIATPSGHFPPLTAEVFAFPGVAADLGRLGFRELGDLEALRIGGRGVLEPLFRQAGFPPNSDFFPVIDQRAPRSRFKNEAPRSCASCANRRAHFSALLDTESRTRWPASSAGANRPVRVDHALAGAEAIGIFLSGASNRRRRASREFPPLGAPGAKPPRQLLRRARAVDRGGHRRGAPVLALSRARTSPFFSIASRDRDAFAPRRGWPRARAAAASHQRSRCRSHGRACREAAANAHGRAGKRTRLLRDGGDDGTPSRKEGP